jgi:tetratricopeptide (TPR) repeat protein
MVGAAAAPAPQDDKDPQRLFDSLYGADLVRVTTTTDKTDDVALARQMLGGARAMKGRPELLALICEKVHELGLRHPSGHAAAAAAMELLAEKVPDRRVDALRNLVALRQRSYLAARGFDRLVAGELFIETLSLLADAAAQHGDYAEATAACGRAVAFAANANSPAANALRRKRIRLAALLRAAKRLQAYENHLKVKPADRLTRNKAILLRVVEMDDPAGAARLLSDDADQALRTYVPLATRPIDALAEPAVLELADWYYNLAASASKAGKANVWARARTYYRRYLELHRARDASRTKAEMIIRRVDRDLDRAAPREPWLDNPYRRIPPALAAFARARNRLPGEAQFQLTVEKLKEVNGLEQLRAHARYDREQKLVHLDIGGNRDLVTIDPLAGLPITGLSLAHCRSLEPDLAALWGMKLTELDLRGCAKLKSLDGLQGMGLERLYVSYCEDLQGDLTVLKRSRLTTLRISGPTGLTLDGLAALTTLESLSLSLCRVDDNLAALKGTKLASLRMSSVSGVTDLTSLKALPIEQLSLRGMDDLKSLSGIEGMPLDSLVVSGCRGLRQDPAILKGMNLTTLTLEGWQDVKDLRFLEGMPLRMLTLGQCSQLTGDLAALSGSRLSHLTLSQCPNLSGLSGIQRLPLTRLSLWGCEKALEKDLELIKQIRTLRHVWTGDRQRDVEIMNAIRPGRKKR